MKKFIPFLIAVIMLFALPVCVSAENGTVTYNGTAKEFIFAPGSEYSPTDLFANFKDVMPGDSLTQKVTVKNDAAKNVKVKIYMRSLGAHENSVEFLSGLHLGVRKSEDNQMAYMFDAAANETAGLTDWVCLGTLYSGGVVNLDVTLDVPVELDNMYSSFIGYLDWEFMVEELPVEEGDPQYPQTGDDTNIILWVAVFAAAIAVIIFIIIWRRKENKPKK